MGPAIGIDFGTTNSAIAVVGADGSVRTQHIRYKDEDLEVFRSILFFAAAEKGTGKRMQAYAGPEAIDHYLHSDHGGRLMQSLKSYLSNSQLTATNLFGRNYRLEELLAFLLRSLKENVSPLLDEKKKTIVVGRPVRFVGASKAADDELAVRRLKEALSIAGIEDVEFEFEPVAAAYAYETRLTKNELLLVGDFGGGTTDFTIVEVGPSHGKKKSPRKRILASEGLGLAGDAFDAKLVRHLVSPLLGRGSQCRLLEKTAAMPNWPYMKLEHWHHLSFLKSKDNMDALQSLRAQAMEPDKIEALILLVSEDMGFQLHKAVQRTKVELSSAEKAQFEFKAPGIRIAKDVTRKEFERWIADELHSIEKSLDAVVKHSGVSAEKIDRVFLTGGSSLVPSVRRIFAKRFGEEKLAGGAEFTSVAQGLALRATEMQAR